MNEKWVDKLTECILNGGTQKDVASIYATAMLDGQQKRILDPRIDWPKINKIIINRWSVSGLSRVKEMAWKQIEETE